MDGQQYYDNRDRRDDQQQASAPAYPPQQQQQQSPPHSASPFAFAPPPLSSATAPQQQQQQQRPQPVHHQQSEPLPSVQYQPSYYNARPALPAHSASYPASAPMGAGPGGAGGYRSYSNESPGGRASPGPMSRTASMNYSQAPGQQSPSAYNGNGYANRSTSGVYASHSPSARPAPYPHPHASYYGSHPYQQAAPGPASAAQPGSVDMPRSLSYPNYSQSYPSYMPQGPAQGPPAYPSHHHPGLPPLMRHNTTSTIGDGVGNMDLNRQGMGYAFANRLPLVDRPFKCDECVQSFNRNHDLKRHKRIHLQVKPFGCDKCGKTFSRKDALRRHWLVKGCRGEDGATAPILPLYPLNSQPPALSPPTPPHASSPTEGSFGQSGNMSFNHPSAPPPLGTLPPRQHNESSTTLLVTPSDVPSVTPGIVSLDDPAPMMHRTSESSTGSYFEAAQQQGPGGVSIMMEKSRSSGSYAGAGASPRYASAMQQHQHHPYRRPSPQRTQTESPTYGKPVFATSFYDNAGGMLAPDATAAAIKMEKQLSQMSHTSNEGAAGPPPGTDSQTWQRWHRPSFPFPPPSGTNYNYQQPPSPVDMQQQQQAQQGYA